MLDILKASTLRMAVLREIDLIQFYLRKLKKTYVFKDGNLRGFFFSLVDDYRK